MTEAELEESERDVAKGWLEENAAELWLRTYQETWSASTAAHFLGWTEDDVLAAAKEQRIFGIPVRDRLRFPRWQPAWARQDGLSPTSRPSCPS